MKTCLILMLSGLLAGCCGLGNPDAEEIVELQHQRDQLMSMVIKIYQQTHESPEDVLPRVLATHPSAPRPEEWNRNRATLSVDALTHEVLWLKRLCLEVPESPAMLEKLRKLSEQTDGESTSKTAPSAASEASHP